MKKRLIVVVIIFIALIGVITYSFFYNPIVQYAKTSYQNIAYKKTDDGFIYLDIYLPITRVHKKNPVVVFFHGGSWVAGQKEYIAEFALTADILRKNGYAVISAEYRFADDYNKYERTINDCTDVLRWVVVNANKYDFDINKIGTMGFSSGAHLALMAGLAQDTFLGEGDLKGTDYNVNYIVAVAPPANFDIEKMTEISNDKSANAYCTEIIEYFIGGSYEDMKDDYYRASPFPYIENADKKPDIFLVHGGSDQVVDIQNSYTLRDFALENGFKVDFLEVKSGFHRFFDPWYITDPPKEEVFEKIADFIIKH